ncbi:uncharacterized protein K452DRAFT_291415 [Aplosporella prunicola CBS 121167]|uniref:Xylanolytic transcriptional activator regulatory domain-containing protein n=1 Tax=Aplosporella prunicola CBS 121167 TaxID=1176127 RepID=A0A6A6B3Q7_9PEZI|nr:uncharacterized protein K452DRAFT_291415 [Aplosporella prunicola CBS 121167]KAF2137597.1 hypothetical protein K452DRAFT_291415 [Aplosporella prunicola CBS 121167]
MQIVEIGTLRTTSNDESSFIGSSTGICFVNTVRNAFRASKHGHGPAPPDNPAGPDHDRPNPLEDFILADGDDSRPGTPSRPLPAPAPTIARGPSYDAAPPGIGRAPDAATSRKLMVLYFKLWHPLFPFVHGPTFYREVEALYDPSKPFHNPPGNDPDRHRCCRAIITQCILNIAEMGTDKNLLPRYSRIESAHSLLFSLSSLATKQDLHSLQALFAAQLYLLTAGSFRSSSAIGGTLAKSLFHAGLHRCPYRYPQLSEHERDLRKRLFWSAYVVDRYLSQGLGLPLGFQDSDIDVCLPGEERHRPVILRETSSGEAARSQYPREPSTAPISTTIVARVASQSNGSGVECRAGPSIDGERMFARRNPKEEHRDIVLTGLVGYSQLTGRAVELFHKSIHVRSVDHSKILYITADIHSWWNSLPPKLSDQDTVVYPRGEPGDDDSVSFVPLFTILYQQLLLLVNRPCLSMNPTSPEFMASMQTCIGAARTIIGGLEMQLQVRQPFFLPELLSASWMAGLILVFACQVRYYPAEKGHAEIQACLQILRLMSDHWKSATNYYKTLTSLFADLQACHSASTTATTNVTTASKRVFSTTEDDARARKRARTTPQDENEMRPSGGLTPSAAIHRALSSGADSQPYRTPSLQRASSSLSEANALHTPVAHLSPQSLYAAAADQAAAQMGGSAAANNATLTNSALTTSPLPFQLPQQSPQVGAAQQSYMQNMSPPGPGSAAFDHQQQQGLWHDPAIYADGTAFSFLSADPQGAWDPDALDPDISAVDAFGQVTWGSLDGEFARAMGAPSR